MVNVGHVSDCRFARSPVLQVPSGFKVLASCFDNMLFLASCFDDMHPVSIRRVVSGEEGRRVPILLSSVQVSPSTCENLDYMYSGTLFFKKTHHARTLP